MRPPGRSTSAAFFAPRTGSTQCQACPAITTSKVRPAGSNLEPRDLDLDLETAAAGELGHSLVRLDPQHSAPFLPERPGRDAGARSHIEEVAPRLAARTASTIAFG